MFYDTNVATSPVDVLNNLQAFLVAHSVFTIDSFVADGAGKRLALSYDGIHWTLKAVMNETITWRTGVQFFLNQSGLFAYPSTGYSGSAEFNLQAGGPVEGSGYQVPAGIAFAGAIPKYHFFAQASPAVCYIVLEYTAGHFHIMGFGELAKVGDYSGGQFLFGVERGDDMTNKQSGNWIGGTNTFLSGQGQAYLYINGMDGGVGWCRSDRNYSPPGGSTFIYDMWCFLQGVAEALPISFNSDTGLVPRAVFKIGGGGFRPMGLLPGAFEFNVKYHAPGDEYTLGADTYRVFPYWFKSPFQPQGGGINTNYSGYYGYAIKSN